MKKIKIITGIILVSLLAGAGGLKLGGASLLASAKPSAIQSSHHRIEVKSSRHIYYRNEAVILLFHDFSWQERGTAITPRRFASDLQMLHDDGFNVVSLNDIYAFLHGRKNLPPNAVAITFDDGYESNYKVAYPLLKARKWPATIFVVVSNIGRTESPRIKTSRLLTWEQMKEMSKHGITFGSHTYNGHFCTEDYRGKVLPWLMARLPGETPQDYANRVLQDLTFSKKLLSENLGANVEEFAFPYGSYNKISLALAKKAGYQYVFTTKHLPVTRSSSPYELGRVSVGIGGTSPQKVKQLILQTAASR